MNLNEPCFDSVLAIDSQLQKLQTEVATMNAEFANYKPPSSGRPARMHHQQSNMSTPSPEIEEERKTNGKPRVTFKDDPAGASSRDILRSQQQKNAICESHLQAQHMHDLSHQYCDSQMGLTSTVNCTQQESRLRYQNLPSVQQSTAQAQNSFVASRIKPQITKQYVSTLQQGRPDLSILEEEFEYRDKFYEPQYSDSGTADIQFRETESQIRHEETVNQQILRAQSEDLYNSFF